MGFFSKLSLGRTRGRAEQLIKAFKPSDLKHVIFVLGLDPNTHKGFTPEIAYRLAKEHPELADKIIRRKFSSWK